MLEEKQRSVLESLLNAQNIAVNSYSNFVVVLVKYGDKRGKMIFL